MTNIVNNIINTNTFYENHLIDAIKNRNEQIYMKTNLEKKIYPETIKMSNFVIGADNEDYFFDEIIKQIKFGSKNSEPYLLGPVYYNKNNKPIDFQCNFTETGKIGESFFEIANRGLIEEAGLCFKQEAIFLMRKHSITRKHSFQDCMTYLVHSSQLQPVNLEEYNEAEDFFNKDDYIGEKNGMKHLHKSQIFVYGTQEELDSLIKGITVKPIKK
jgi:hypothetical protein